MNSGLSAGLDTNAEDETASETSSGTPVAAETARLVTGELKTLFQQSSHYLVGLIGGLALGFVSFPIFTRAFSVADYGLIDFAQKILLLLTATSKCGMQNSALRFFDGDAFAKDSGAAQRYYSSMLFSVTATGAIVTFLFVAVLHLVPESMVSGPMVAVLVFTSALIVLRSMQSMLWSFLRIEERTKLYNVLSFVIRGGTIAAVCLLIPLTGPTVKTYFTGTMGVEFAVVLAVTVPLFRRGLLHLKGLDFDLCRAGFVFGVPLVIQELAGIVLDTGDRGLVQYYLGGEALGLYSVAYGLSTYVNSLLIAPLSLAILPIYLRIWNTRGREATIVFLSLGLDLFLMAAVGLFVIASVTAQDAVIVLASPKYRGAETLIPTLVAGLLIYTTYIFLNAGLVIEKRTKVFGGVLLCAAVLNIALNCLLLPRIGLQAAALATLLSYGLCTVLLSIYSFKVLPLNVEWLALARYLCAGGITWALVVHVHFHLLWVNLLAKPSTAVLVYAALLYVLDRRVREFAKQLPTRLGIQPSAASGIKGIK